MQLKVSKAINFFEEMLRNKFSFEEYTSIDKPTLFFGLYKGNDFIELQRHRGVKIAWFAGTDALRLLTAVKAGKQNAQELLKDATVVAESSWIEKDLKELRIDYVSISLFIDDIYSWHSEPPGESLYWYGANTTKHGKKYVKEIRKAFPGINIITNDRLTVPHNMMPEVYKKCFAGIRMIDHDGMSQTVGEMGLMGRMSIWNGGGPMSIRYNSTEDVIEAIKTIKRGFNHKLVTKRNRGFFIEN